MPMTNKRAGFRMEPEAAFQSFMESSPRPKDSEDKDLCDITGHCGPWQMRTFAIFLLVSCSGCWHNLVLAFLSPSVRHWCRQTGNATAWRPGEPSWCHDGQQKCRAWAYDTRTFQSTIVSEWDLVCDRKWLTSLAKSVFMLGHLFSSLFIVQLSDRFGRRPVILWCYAVFWVCALLTTLANSIGVFLLLRFLVALGLTAAYTIAFVSVMEVMGPEVRPLYGVACKFGWTAGYVTLPGVAWLVRDWRSLQMAITFPWIGMAAMWWFLEESPRWLLVSGRVDSAERLLLDACRKNGKSIDEVQGPLLKLCSKTLKEKGTSARKEDFSDLMNYPNLKRSLVYLFFVWFSTSLVYYALTWGTDELEGNPYWNFFLSGLVEVPATLLCLLVTGRFGRRRPLAWSAFVAGGTLTFYSCMVAWEDLRGTLLWFMAAKFCTCMAFALLYVYSSELLPTSVRGLGLGYCSVAARLGAILAPFVAHMGGHSQPHLCYWTYGLLGVSSGLCILVLPETSNRKLPDTLLEGEHFHRHEVIINCRSLSVT